MSYLLSQLWLCLFVSSLLGVIIGWFLRGDNKAKLNIIENRWRKRFSELEYSNQELVKKLKHGDNIENKYAHLQTRLKRMNKAADLSSLQLKYKNDMLSKIEQDLELSNNKIIDKESQISELISQLANDDTRLKDNSSIKTSIRTDATSVDNDLAKQLEEKSAKYHKMKNKYKKLVEKADSYKASLIDAESKLHITAAMLKEYTHPSDEK